jgi:hypothetical protein
MALKARCVLVCKKRTDDFAGSTFPSTVSHRCSLILSLNSQSASQKGEVVPAALLSPEPKPVQARPAGPLTGRRPQAGVMDTSPSSNDGTPTSAVGTGIERPQAAAEAGVGGSAAVSSSAANVSALQTASILAAKVVSVQPVVSASATKPSAAPYPPARTPATALSSATPSLNDASFLSLGTYIDETAVVPQTGKFGGRRDGQRDGQSGG